MSEYPEHDKLAAVSAETQTVGEFLDWLSSQGLHIAEFIKGRFDERLVPVGMSIQDLLAEWKDIDRDAIEREKRAMLAKIAATNDPEVEVS